MIIKVIYKDKRIAYLDNVLFVEETPLKSSIDNKEFLGLRVDRLIGERISSMKPIRMEQIELWDIIL